MTLNFTVAVHGTRTSDSQRSALAFVSALLDAGHRMHRVFFYHDGVLVASRRSGQADLAFRMGAEWKSLAEHHGFELAICVGAATRRALLDDRDPADTSRILAGFEVVGLGQLVEAIAASDRFVTFAA